MEVRREAGEVVLRANCAGISSNLPNCHLVKTGLSFTLFIPTQLRERSHEFAHVQEVEEADHRTIVRAFSRLNAHSTENDRPAGRFFVVRGNHDRQFRRHQEKAGQEAG
ncbi:MAG: hypothetical protein U0521_02760 [Anaerolineae bacterium]